LTPPQFAHELLVYLRTALHTPDIASRISGLSAPGEVLVSDIVRGLVRTSTDAQFKDCGEHTLKGVGEPVRVWGGTRWRLVERDIQQAKSAATSPHVRERRGALKEGRPPPIRHLLTGW
jgi:class 3 adenylate cyclase